MIVPSEKLKKFVDIYDKDRASLCKRIDIDEAMLSLLMKGKRGASASTIEKVCVFTGFPMHEAWEIVEQEEAE